MHININPKSLHKHMGTKTIYPKKNQQEQYILKNINNIYIKD